MSDNPIVEKGSSVESGAEYQIHTYKHVIINVLMRREDYESLKKQGGPRPDQISMALRHYLKLITEEKWRPEMGISKQRREVSDFPMRRFQRPMERNQKSGRPSRLTHA